MNLTDLRDELTLHADDLGPAPDLRAGVAARVRRTKRRRATVGAAATLAVAALAVGVVTDLGRSAPTVPASSATRSSAPMIGPMIGPDGMPYRDVPDARGDVVKNGLRYRAQVADDTLAVGFIGDAGQGQFTMVWDPTTTHASIGAECFLPGLTQEQAVGYLVKVGFDGATGFFASTCSGGRPSQRDLPPGGTSPGEPGQGWPELAVGKPARLRVQLIDARTQKPAAVDGVQLTGAVYEQGARQDVVDASGRTVASLPAVLEHEGYRYRFLAMQAGPAGTTPLPHLATPAGVPFLVTAGSTGPDTSADAGTTYVTGLDAQPGSTSGGWQTVPQPARAAGTVGLRTEGKAPTGTALLALYVPER